MTYSVCVDASLAILWVMPTPKTEQAMKLIARWAEDGARMIGPPLLTAELTSVLRLQVYLKRLLEDEGDQAFAQANQLAIETVNPPGLYEEAWKLAKRYGRPRTYDMQYVALALLMDCDLWTADRRLVNALAEREPRVRWVGEA